MGSPAAPLERAGPLKGAPSPGVITEGIENKLHWVRDMAYEEDRSQIRTGRGSAGHGRPAQLQHQLPAAGRLGQHRKRAAAVRKRLAPSPEPPRDLTSRGCPHLHRGGNRRARRSLTATPHPSSSRSAYPEAATGPPPSQNPTPHATLTPGTLTGTCQTDEPCGHPQAGSIRRRVCPPRPRRPHHHAPPPWLKKSPRAGAPARGDFPYHSRVLA